MFTIIFIIYKKNLKKKSSPLKENFVPRKLAFLQQPSETAVANRYMFPAPAVCIVPSVGGTSSTYIVCASLAYHGLLFLLSFSILIKFFLLVNKDHI